MMRRTDRAVRGMQCREDVAPRGRDHKVLASGAVEGWRGRRPVDERDANERGVPVDDACVGLGQGAHGSEPGGEEEEARWPEHGGRIERVGERPRAG